MSLPIPNLDDRDFDQLLTEAQVLIPKNFPTWTDHNFSDPGIALIELFAFLTEATIYQTNQISERSLKNFAALVGVNQSNDEAIEVTLQRALETLQARYRAVTEKDFENLIKKTFAKQIVRVKAIFTVVSSTSKNVYPNDQLIKVIILPKSKNTVDNNVLKQEIYKFLRERCLITTRIKIVISENTELSIDMTVVRSITSTVNQDNLKENIKDTINQFLSPTEGGENGKGWEFERSVFRSELYQLIEGVAGVDHVQTLILNKESQAYEIRLTQDKPLVGLKELNIKIGG
jgi:hypothetical protein